MKVSWKFIFDIEWCYLYVNNAEGFAEINRMESIFNTNIYTHTNTEK